MRRIHTEAKTKKLTEVLISFGSIFYGCELVECNGRQSIRHSCRESINVRLTAH